jgi:hypothetical protein
VRYFNGRDRHLAENGITRVGSARSPDLVDWEPDPAPAFEDDDHATTAGTIRLVPSVLLDGLTVHFDVQAVPLGLGGDP